MRTYQESARVFKALCDPKRLAILEQLRSGEKCACVLQEPMDLTQSGLCCFSKRMRKFFRKNEKSMLQFCNKNSKRKGRLQWVKKPL